MCTSPGIVWLPISLVLCMVIGTLTCYGVAVANGDIAAIFPYISDTGASIPETFIFSLFFNVAAFLGFASQYVRYRYILNAIRDSDTRARRMANANIVLGICSDVGLLFVANFPESIYEWVHDAGAIVLFVCGTTYTFLDSCITRRMFPVWSTHLLYTVRFLLSCCTLAALIIMLVAEIVSTIQWYQSKVPEGDTFLLWNEEDPGYTAHLWSTFAEWVMAMFFLSYFLTYIYEFRRFDAQVKIHLLPMNGGGSKHQRATENTRLVATSGRGATFSSTLESDPSTSGVSSGSSG